MADKNYGNDSQLAEIVKYISDTMKFPIMGAGGGFAPIGTINFFDASIAPQGWLACDGSIHNISDYPDLATFYASVHGASNFYGGNGTTTFAVPNLQGEFLRGAGTNGHTNQGNGGSVGEHQDATEHKNMLVGQDSGKLFISKSSVNEGVLNTDSEFDKGKITDIGLSSSSQDVGLKTFYTSRPTNTSFLICVKATVAGDANAHQYSTEEQVVGMDENGNPVCEKTVNMSTTTYSIPNGETVLDYQCYITLTSGMRVQNCYVDEGGYYAYSYVSNQNVFNISTKNLTVSKARLVYHYTKSS